MSTANVARDLDLLRQAVGDAKLNYAGFSYGTYLGADLRQHVPEQRPRDRHRRRARPDRLVDRERRRGATVPFSTRLHSDAGAQATLDEFFRLCDAGGDELRVAPAARRPLRRARRSAKAHPLQVTFPDGSTAELNYSILIGITLGAMYDSSSWEDFAQRAGRHRGTGEPATLGVRLQPFWHPANAYITKRGFPHYQNFLEGFPAVACADSRQPGLVRGLVDAGAAADARVRLLRADLDLGLGDLRRRGRAPTRDRYIGPFNQRPRPTRCSSSATSSTRRPATREP